VLYECQLGNSCGKQEEKSIIYKMINKVKLGVGQWFEPIANVGTDKYPPTSSTIDDADFLTHHKIQGSSTLVHGRNLISSLTN
jgi:hypothetical protein